jgi:hypothetical protein
MSVDLTIPREIASTLLDHLAAGRDEQLAFMLARPTVGGFAVTDIRTVGWHGLDDQTAWHLALADDERAAVIKWAHEAGGVLVEAHVHLGGFPAALSAYDIDNLADWVPHVWWRLRHRPYVALVFSGRTFDGLAWLASPDEPEQVSSLIIEGARAQMATGRTLRAARGNWEESA